jgi:Flp pilus assembly protein TadB
MHTTITTMTHAEQAWLILLPPAILTALICSTCILLLRRPLQHMLERFSTHRGRSDGGRSETTTIDSALQWDPRPLDLERVLAVSAIGAGIVAGSGTLIVPTWVVIALSLPVTMLVIAILLSIATRRYAATLERDLTPAVGRMAALLRSGNSFQTALERLTADMPGVPLRDEWNYLLERVGMPLADGGLATPRQVVLALAAQTPVARHAFFLDHLSVAVGQPQDVLSRRCDAAYEAFLASERRRHETRTELSQMRYSGIAIGLAGIGMAVYLALTQWERVISAYSTPIGAIFGLIVGAALLLPIAGGMLLARVEDIDY